MNTHDILNILLGFTASKSYIDVLPSNKLNTRKQKPADIAANTNPAWLPREHCVAYHFALNRVAAFFDSFGLLPTNKNIFSLTCGSYFVFKLLAYR